MRKLILTSLIFTFAMQASALRKAPTDYKSHIAAIKSLHKSIPAHVVFIKASLSVTGGVKRPGAYVFRKGMNIKELIKTSGGLEKKEELSSIEVLRPTPERLNPVEGQGTVTCSLREKDVCDYLLEEGDLVIIHQSVEVAI